MVPMDPLLDSQERLLNTDHASSPNNFDRDERDESIQDVDHIIMKTRKGTKVLFFYADSCLTFELLLFLTSNVILFTRERSSKGLLFTLLFFFFLLLFFLLLG
jgi:hypothetical protein